MSPNPWPRWATCGTISSAFREIELRRDRLESVGLVAHLLPQPAGRTASPLPSCELLKLRGEEAFGSGLDGFFDSRV
jgi:hypothetical protein